MNMLADRLRLVIGLAIASLACAAVAAAQTATALDEGAWHTLVVPGGRPTIRALGIDDSRERAMVMIDLVRRLHFPGVEDRVLRATLPELTAAMADYDVFRNAVALVGPPPALSMASDKKARGKFKDALEAAGLNLKENKKKFTVELRTNDTAVALRKRLSLIGIRAEAIRQTLNDGGSMTADLRTIELPLPLSPQTWAKTIFERDVVPRRLFIEILGDPSARLLFHGLAGMDAATRRWIAGQPDLLRRIYRDAEAVRAFSLFATAIRIADGRVVVPGGPVGARRWSAVLDADPARPDRFVRRLLDHNGGRTAGLYFTVASVDEPRRRYLLGTAIDSDEDDRFKRLVGAFSNCYPADATQYPFFLRSHDAALLLLDINITGDGRLAGPTWRRFWERALDGDSLPDDPADTLGDVKSNGVIDPAWIVDTLCSASATRRGDIFVTMLAGQRVFAGIRDADLPDALVALRARRLYPAVLMAAEHAGLRSPATLASLARHAERIAGVEDRERGVTAQRQFQGALALTLNAINATTLTGQGETLLRSLGAVAPQSERYDGRIADWLFDQWLPAARQSLKQDGDSVEDLVAWALAGPPVAAPRRLQWEGQDYVLDLSGAAHRRIAEVRAKQGGITLDDVDRIRRVSLALRQAGVTLEQVKAQRAELQNLAPRFRRMARADEYADEGPKVDEVLANVARDLAKVDEARDLKRAAEAGDDLLRPIDFLLAHALGAWAYAPLLSGPESSALLGGDPSLRHQFGVAIAGNQKNEKRWEVALSLGSARSVTGSLLGLQVAFANETLRRLAADTVPPPPTIVGNDLLSLMLTAALADPRRLDDGKRDDVARMVAAGSQAIEAAGTNLDQLSQLAANAAMSPWRREALAWTVAQESHRLPEQFSITERARLGGATAATLRDWGSVSIVTGCMCVQAPPARLPELSIGRAADGLIGGHSADLMLRIAVVLAELKQPAQLAPFVMSYAMRDFLDTVSPGHAADFDEFSRVAAKLDRRTIEDYLGAVAAAGPLKPADSRQ